MNKINKISLAALILCSISSTGAFAQDTDPNAPVAVDPAVVRAMDYNPSWYVQANADLLRPDSEFGVGEHGAGFGFAIGKPLSEDWDIQIGTKYANQRLNGLIRIRLGHSSFCWFFYSFHFRFLASIFAAFS